MLKVTVVKSQKKPFFLALMKNRLLEDAFAVLSKCPKLAHVEIASNG